MNAVVRTEAMNVTSLQVNEGELIKVLQNSLYPGAATESIKLVLGYCKAQQLDPLQKPVHIVPMYDRASGKMRDVIMPGIGLYRTQAARSGCYAGMSEPEFGPDITERVGGEEITYPQWCKVTVKRQLSNGTIAEFSSIERWKENYAVKGGKERSVAPNAMWTKRPYGQLAKCASAQALRCAFPEVGSQATAEEMEGKQIEEEAIDNTTGEITKAAAPVAPVTPPAYSAEQFAKNLPAWSKLIEDGKKTAEQIIALVSSKAVLSAEQKDQINAIEPAVADAEFVTEMEQTS